MALNVRNPATRNAKETVTSPPGKELKPLFSGFRTKSFNDPFVKNNKTRRKSLFQNGLSILHFFESKKIFHFGKLMTRKADDLCCSA